MSMIKNPLLSIGYINSIMSNMRISRRFTVIYRKVGLECLL